MNLIPRKGMCFILPDKRPNMAGMLHLPETRAHVSLPTSGYVRFLNDPKAEFKVGDHVWYRPFEQEMLEIRDERLSMVKTSEVMAIL